MRLRLRLTIDLTRKPAEVAAEPEPQYERPAQAPQVDVKGSYNLERSPQHDYDRPRIGFRRMEDQ